MSIVLFVLILLHGIIHLLGFVKGLGIKDVNALKQPISKPKGIVWLITSVLFLIFGCLYLSHFSYAWLAGFVAVFLSQWLIVSSWKDAKFGTIPNAIIVLVSVGMLGSFHVQSTTRNETNRLLNNNKVLYTDHPITERDIRSLPTPVSHWLRHAGMVGKPMIHAGKVMQKAELKLRPKQKEWMPASAIQYTTIDQPAFIWAVSVPLNDALFFTGRDLFENGKGHMLIRVNSLINVVNEKGGKIDEGSLQRYLGEMVWFPSLAVSPYITWEPLNDSTARATMTYKGTKGSGTFRFNAEGDVTRFSALRFKDNTAHAKRYEWIMQITGYNTFEGIRVPARMTATWKLDEGDWTWLKLDITDIRYNKNATE